MLIKDISSLLNTNFKSSTHDFPFNNNSDSIFDYFYTGKNEIDLNTLHTIGEKNNLKFLIPINYWKKFSLKSKYILPIIPYHLLNQNNITNFSTIFISEIPFQSIDISNIIQSILEIKQTSSQEIYLDIENPIQIENSELEKIKNDRELENEIIDNLKEQRINLSNNKRFILVTGHRRENHGQGFINICKALKNIALNNQNVDIIYPVHLNPNVQEPVNAELSDFPNIFLIKPLEYKHFVYLMYKSYLILTDSGGIQEEAPSLGKPVFVMRGTTERPEALDAGTVKLVGIDTDKIVKNVQALLDDESMYQSMSFAHNPYGDGSACKKIIKFIKELYC